MADVAGDVALSAALTEVTSTLTAARAEGRLILRLPLVDIKDDHIIRDRIAVDDDEMAALTASLRLRGQQVPIEVADISQTAGLGQPVWGLITGWRRLMALRALAAAGEGPDTVLAILRRPEDGPAAYVAMVEENEIRAGLSFYERARIVVQAVEQGVYRADRVALAHLFAAAPAARRSKIGSFIRIVRALDGSLRFPTALSEKAGLTLSAAIEGDSTLVPRLVAAFAATPPATPAAELTLITQALRPVAALPVSQGDSAVEPDAGLSGPVAKSISESDPGAVTVTQDGPDRLILTAPGLSSGPFRDRLMRWLAQQNRL